MELEILRCIAEEAGRRIMGVYRQAVQPTRKEDGSPVTLADRLAHEWIAEALQRHFPGVPVVSEEGCTTLPPVGESFFLVDPLDGTKEFVQRNGEFTVNLAWVQDGMALAGVVLAPALGEGFAGASRFGAYRFGQGGECPIVTAMAEPGRPLRVLGSRSHGGDEIGVWMGRWGRPYELQPAGSSLKFCRIAEGRADVYPRLGPTAQWDTAAGQAVLEAAGGTVLTLDGQPVTYGASRPLIQSPFVAVARRDLIPEGVLSAR